MTATEDNLELLIPGAQLTHLLTIVSDDGLRSLKTVIDTIDREGATLHGANLARLGPSMVHRIRIGGIRASAARDVARRLENLSGVTRVSVEHYVSREPDSAR
ncbi:hypothetical protein DDF62_22535 [Caulobacter radicis]|uniref:hypothetical protein n=1 Tax=Caulobacter radicis TaxID=2172650 RepID=UPI000D5816B9|nr:hypothetical protein [Caulobacter radicis]PVM84507.1 hypothetical protein DDF62_22535 [Caulobacter radicis]